MGQTTDYTYAPIQPDQLRMCQFVDDGDYLSARIKTFSTDGSQPPYKALSYTWGENQDGQRKNWMLKIGERYMPVLDSLQSFVQALRSTKTLLDGTWWWIDSICIDQTNTSERDEHVRRMKAIYQKASEVIVWLGEQSDDSECALDFIYSLDKMDRDNVGKEDLRVVLQEDKYHADWIAFKNFFLRRWWARIWTIQEFVIPSNVSFWCGPRRISREIIFSALAVSDRCNSLIFKNSPAFNHAWTRRRAWYLNKLVPKEGGKVTLSLLALAAYFCSNEATDDRDRLYGLTGLCTENHGIDVNYAWSVEEVYLRFAQSFITKHTSLDIICFASLFAATSESSLPSWVPDWRTKTQSLVIPLTASQGSTDFVGSLRPPSTFYHSETPTRYAASGSRAAVFQFEGSALLAQGCIIDTVDGLAGSRDNELVQSTGQHSQCSDTAPPPTEALTRICRSLVLDRKDRHLRYPMPTEEFYRNFIHLCLLLISESQHSVYKEFQDWFNSTRLLRVRGHCFEDILRSVQHDNLESLLQSAPDQDEYIQDSFYGRFFDVVERMVLRVMTSCNGRIGMVPQGAIKGDLICVLFGCSVPVLLRRSEHSDQFMFVGECFLDGCMEGEALEQGAFMERTFHII